MQLYISVINSLNKEALSLPDETEYCNTEETVDDITDIADSSLDLINSHRLPSLKFHVLHDIHIVLSLVQTNFEAILSYIYIIQEVRHYIYVCLSGTLD